MTTDTLPGVFSFKAATHKLAGRIKVRREAALRYALPSKMKGGGVELSLRAPFLKLSRLEIDA